MSDQERHRRQKGARMRQWTVDANEPLLACLMRSLDLKRTAIKSLLKFGAISVNGNQVRQFDHPLVPGDQVRIEQIQSARAADRLGHAGIRLIYEDDALVVLDKPVGLLTVANDNCTTDTLFFRLNDFFRNREPGVTRRGWVVHRIDQETSGLVLFAKSEHVKHLLQAAWSQVEKTYWAVVEGRPENDRGTIKTYLTQCRALKVYSSDHPIPDARLATTHYRVVQTRRDYALLEVRLETGRKHQIRVQLASIGCAVAGDRRYRAKSNPCHRLALHAGGLALAHPISGQPLKFESPIPRVFTSLFR